MMETLTGTLRVEETNSVPAFLALEGAWNGMVERTGGAVDQRHEFVRAFIESHAREERLRILTAWDGDRLAAALPLFHQRSSFYGFTIRRLAGLVNFHYTRFDMAAEDPAAAAGAFLDYLAEDGQWDLLSLDFIPAGGRAWAVPDAAAARGFRTFRRDHLLSPTVRLPATMPELRSRLSARFRSNLRRRRRELESLGPVTLERYAAGPELEEKLRAGFSLERGGWKGRQGTAIELNGALSAFYASLSKSAAERGYLALYFLMLGGKPIAFHHGLAYNGTYLLLKPGYDEAYARFSPGQLLVEDVLADCISRGYGEFDFMGESMAWKRDWTAEARPHGTAWVFQDSAYGRFLWSLRFRWGPLVKKWLGRSPEAVPVPG